MAQRQTASFLQQRFREVGIRPQTRHGQNFLIDLNLIDVLVREADLGPQDVVLEVGTGTGALTAKLAEAAGAVVTVELDPQLHQLAREELWGVTNVELLHQDVLRNKNNLHAHVLATVDQQMAAVPGARLKLAANLPYNIATPLISNLLLTPVTPVSMTVTIQKELADRITAKPSTKEYGSLSVWVQSQCEATTVRILPPSVFWPRPKVESAIIHIEVDQYRREHLPDLAFLNRFVRSLFLHRRKFLRSVLSSAFKRELTKPEIDEVLEDLGLKGEVRAEALDVETILTLAEAMRQRLAATEAETNG